ncbi:MAG: acyltransferase family protein [Acidaminobacteraceae bacterium]
MRNYKIDTLKGLMIFLVVFGHYIEHLTFISGIPRIIYLLIYMIHMPVFVYVSGMTFKLSKNRNNIGFFIFSIILAQAMFSTLSHFIYGTIHIDYWILWYLYAMIAWTLLTRYIKVNLITIALSILASLFFSTFSHNDVWRFSRIVTLYPYFLGGYYMIHTKVNLKSLVLKISIFAVLAYTYVMQMLLTSAVPISLLYNSKSYKVLGLSTLNGGLMKIMLYFIGFYAVFLLINIGYENAWLSKCGKNSIIIYLIHGMIAKILKDVVGETSIILLLILALLTLLVFSSDSMAKFYKKGYNCLTNAFSKLKITSE